MKEEDLIYSLAKLDPEIIEKADPLTASEHKDIPIRKGMSKMAVATIAFVCVLVLSGGIAWAMNSTAIKDYFFPNSAEEFKEVYTDTGREFNLGNYRLVYEGSAYEEAVESGYLNFSIWDKEWNPVILSGDDYKMDDAIISAGLLTPNCYIWAHKFKTGGANWYFVGTYYSGLFVDHTEEDNNLFIRFSRLAPDDNGVNRYTGKEFRFLILNEEQWKSLCNDIKALNENELCTYTYDKETDRVIANYDQSALLPEVVDVFNRYDPCGVDTVSYPVQIFNIGKVKITIGRADMTLDYNIYDCELGDFTLKRADGTELRFKRHIDRDPCFTWSIEDGTFINKVSGGGSSDTGVMKIGENYGFILAPDEKVTIEADGKIYE